MAWGLAHRQVSGVEAIGVDEIHWGRGLKADNFLTVIYQIDAGCRRLLWVGRRRTEKTLRQGMKELGAKFVQGLRFVCSDMWKPYLNVLAEEAGQALHVLDRFHITMHLNQAVDEVRRATLATIWLRKEGSGWEQSAPLAQRRIVEGSGNRSASFSLGNAFGSVAIRMFEQSKAEMVGLLMRPRSRNAVQPFVRCRRLSFALS